MIEYCSGNIDILYICTFAEILEIMEFVIERENDENLLKAYEANFCAIRGISLNDFKNAAQVKSANMRGAEQTTEQIEKNIEHYIDDFKWEVV